MLILVTAVRTFDIRFLQTEHRNVGDQWTYVLTVPDSIFSPQGSAEKTDRTRSVKVHAFLASREL